MRRSLITGIVTVASAVLAATVAASPAVAATSTYYVDCGATGGTGSAAAPFSTLAQVNALTLLPGDQVLFKVQTTCLGTLRPHGSGTANAPIVIDHYGGGNWPVIKAPGTATAGPALQLTNQSYVTVRNLQFTGGYFQNVLVSADATGFTSRGIVLQHLGVNGNAFHPSFNQWVTGAGGIVVTPCAETSRIDSVTIDDVYAFDNHETGIQIGYYFMAAWDAASNGYDGENVPNCHMALAGGTGTNSVWAPVDGVTNVRVTNSNLHDNDACGLNVFGATNVLIDGNNLYNNGSGNGASPANPTGMNGEGAWWANTDSVTASHNNAYGNRVGYSGNDGSGLDADTRTSNNLIEYNYLHDNANYGFSLIDGYGVSANTTVRYNVFVNNGAQYTTAPDIMVSRPYATGSVDGLQIYNNTLYSTRANVGIRLQSPFSGVTPNTITNNLIVRAGSATAISTTTANATSDHNVFSTSSGTLGYVYNGTAYSSLAAYQAAAHQDAHSVVTAPALTVPSPLPSASMPASPAFRVPTGAATGVTIGNNGGTDFYGSPVPATGPAIGAVNAG